MNDNRMPNVLRLHPRDQTREAWASQIEDVRQIGIRAIVKPESLTMGEIQDIAWGFLMAARTLERMP